MQQIEHPSCLPLGPAAARSRAHAIATSEAWEDAGD
jgi:hypothetical protein